MGAIIIMLLIFLVVGLFTRTKGDGFLDTLGAGANGCVGIVIAIIIVAIIIYVLVQC